MSSLTKSLGSLAGTVVAVVASAALRGAIVFFGWAWFVTPLGVPGIGYAHAVGVSLALRGLWLERRATAEERAEAEEEPTRVVVAGLITYVAVLGFMYLCYMGAR